jgi:hypothetical protein
LDWLREGPLAETSIEARQEGGSGEIHPGELMAMWIYDEKFLTVI